MAKAKPTVLARLRAELAARETLPPCCREVEHPPCPQHEQYARTQRAPAPKAARRSPS
jgi:hypothetical protein